MNLPPDEAQKLFNALRVLFNYFPGSVWHVNLFGNQEVIVNGQRFYLVPRIPGQETHDLGELVLTCTPPAAPPKLVLKDLQDGQAVRVRLGMARHGSTVWTAWRLVRLYVQRRPASARRSKKTHLAKASSWGDIVVLGIKDEQWAEYGPLDFDSGTFLSEDYYMQIEGLES